MTLASGTEIGSLLIEEQLEAGPHGELYRGRQPGLDRTVRVHRVTRELLATPGVGERLRREAKLASRVLHPNIVQVFDLFSERGDHYLVLEHVDGPDLRSVLERAGRAPVQVASAIGAELAHGLEALHSRGILHRNLRPEIIRVSRWGEIKLAGLEDGQEISDAHPPALAEPSPYSAPELARGAGGDPQADVLSLAAVVFELLTGRLPESPAASPAGCPAALGRLIRRALQPERAARPSLSQLRRAFERAAGRARDDSRISIAAWLWDVRMFGPDAQTRSRIPLEALSSRPRALRVAVPLLAVVGLLALLVPLLRGTTEAPPDGEPVPEVSAQPPSIAARSRPEPAAAVVAPARLSIVAQPWARVRVDRETAFLTPRAAPLELAPGPHEITLSHPRYGEVRLELVLAPGEERTLRHRFEGAPRP